MLKYIQNLKIPNLKKNVYFLYTVLFIVVLLGCFIYYFVDGRSFIWYYDGISIHIKKIIWYRRYIINFFKHLFINHKFILPMFEFNFGEGADIIQAFSGNAIGDPFALFSVFFPERLIAIYYSMFVIIRLYLAGIAFIILCKTLKQQNNIGIVAGALTYAFCMWSIQNANRHIHFLNFNIYLPLLIVGFENILKGKRPYLYIIMVFVMLSNSAYFSYQVVIFMALYVIARLISLKYDPKKFFSTIVIIVGYSIIGLGLSAIIFIPVAQNLLNDTRINQNFANYTFYEPNYYKNLLKYFITYGQSHQTIMGYSALSLFAVIVLFIKTKYKIILKLFFAIAVIMVLFPYFGKLMNGGSYIVNRWIWVPALLVSYILTDAWSYFRTIAKKDYAKIILLVVGYVLISELMSKSVNANLFLQAIIIIDAALLLIFFNHKKKIEYVLLMFTIVSISLNSYYLNSPTSGNYVSEAVKYSEFEKIVFDVPAMEIKNISSNEEEYYRYTAKKVVKEEEELVTDKNDSLVAEISSLEQESSLTNKYLDRGNRYLSLMRSNSHIWEDLDQKTILNTLSNVKYVATYDNKFVPYGYEYISEKDGYYYYKNKYNLPLVYNYKKYISENEFNNYNPIEKQELMIDTAAVYRYNGNFATKNEEFVASSSEISYVITATNSETVDINSKSFITYRNNAEVSINTNFVPKTEMHLLINGLYIRQLHEYDLFYNKNINYRGRLQKIDRNNVFDKSQLTKTQDLFLKDDRKNFRGGKSSIDIKIFVGEKEIDLKYLNSYDSDYGNFHNFDINLGYFEDTFDNIRIVLPRKGIYSFERIKIISLPLEHYDKDILNLKDNEVINIVADNDKVTFDVNSKENKFLCCAIPYSGGWTAYIDGKKTGIYLTNIRYMGIDIPRGDHKVEFRYINKTFVVSAFITLFTFLFFVNFIYICEKHSASSQFSVLDALDHYYEKHM